VRAARGDGDPFGFEKGKARFGCQEGADAEEGFSMASAAIFRSAII